MKITVAKGVGFGETPLSAFDSALKKAGIYNFNLIRLSSIIPQNAEVESVKKYQTKPEEYGNKLYLVMGEIRTDVLNRSIAAGLGWYRNEDGRGVFAEHTDIIERLNAREAENNVRVKIEKTVEDLCKFRGFPFVKKNLQIEIASIEVKTKPACVLVAAVYQSEPFE